MRTYFLILIKYKEYLNIEAEILWSLLQKYLMLHECLARNSINVMGSKKS